MNGAIPRRVLRNSSVTALMLWPHWNIATYWARYYLLTPRNGRRKFRRPVQIPSSVLSWTSRTPSPSSSRAHSPVGVADRRVPAPHLRQPAVAPPLVGVDHRPLQGRPVHAVLQRLADPNAPTTSRRTSPDSRPTTPATGGRSLAKVPWPRRLLARRRGGSAGSGCGMPFSPAFWYISSASTTASPSGLRSSPDPGVALEPVPQLQQLHPVAAQLAGQPGGGGALGEAAEDQRLGGAALRPLQGGAGPGVEDAAAGRAAVVEDRGAVAAVDPEAVARAAARAGQALGVEQVDELGVAGVLVHQVGDREVHERGLRGRPRPPEPIIPTGASSRGHHRLGLMSP